MRFLNSSLILGASALIACPSLQAQGPIVLPALADGVEGNDGQNRLFEGNSFRAQQCILGSTITNGGIADIVSIGYRADSNFSTGAPSGATFPDVVIRVYTTSMTPETIAADFDANVAASTEITTSPVYDCTDAGSDADITFVPNTGSAPEPFNTITFNQTTIFVPTPAEPNLLIDIESFTDPGVTINIDGARAGGHHFEFGAAGPVSCPDPFAAYRLQVSGSSLLGSPGGNRAGMAPGDEYRIFTSVPPCMQNALGTYFLTFGPSNPAGLDLTPAGAPGNFLYGNPAIFVAVPGVWSFSPISGATYVFDIAVPSTTPIGFNFQAQAALADAPANSLGIVTSNAVNMWIGDTGPNHPLGQCACAPYIGPNDGGNGTTFVQYGTSAGIWGGAVINITTQ